MNERHTEYGVGSASELSDDYKPKRNKKKKNKTLSTTTSTEELVYPMLYYFNPELYLQLINNWSMPQHDNPMCKKINECVKTIAAPTIAVVDEILRLGGDEKGYMERLIEIYNQFQDHYKESMDKYINMINKLNHKKMDPFPEAKIRKEKFLHYKKETFKKFMIFIKSTITGIIQNLRQFYDIFYGPYSIVRNFRKIKDIKPIDSTFRLVPVEKYIDEINEIIRANNNF
jgi:hypothetical protein